MLFTGTISASWADFQSDTLKMSMVSALRSYDVSLAGMYGRPSTRDISGYHFVSPPWNSRTHDDYRFAHGKGSQDSSSPKYGAGSIGWSWTTTTLTIYPPSDYDYCWYGPFTMTGYVLVGWKLTK